MKPLIGINLDVKSDVPNLPPQVTLQIKYYEAVQKAGGIPILLPPMPKKDLDQAVKSLHGLLLIGGPDYCPSTYGEEPGETVDVVDPIRGEFDFLLLDRAINVTEIPILGICAGHQLLNIYLGGTLIQDIPEAHPESEVVHGGVDGWRNGRKHNVIFEPGSILADIYKMKSLDVPTSHHQAIKTLGKGLKVTAHAEDGIVEAIEYEQRPFTIGVQWHPERDFEGNKLLFAEFVKQSQAKAG
ncbi:MAG TPA: gamma-glutamyl-gamma-aminobutyrate hydrolase family protein [Chroococcales cyanobacterium]